MQIFRLDPVFPSARHIAGNAILRQPGVSQTFSDVHTQWKARWDRQCLCEQDLQQAQLEVLKCTIALNAALRGVMRALNAKPAARRCYFLPGGTLDVLYQAPSDQIDALSAYAPRIAAASEEEIPAYLRTSFEQSFSASRAAATRRKICQDAAAAAQAARVELDGAWSQAYNALQREIEHNKEVEPK